MDRITIVNPNNTTYRAPIERIQEFRIEASGINVAVFGQMVDKLGRYEDLGLSPEEIEKLLPQKTEKRTKKDA